MNDERVLLDYGSGGKASHRLISELFYKHFANPTLARMDDAALLDIPVSSMVSGAPRLAMSTDSYTVDPWEFPGGNIGTLAVHGTVNDVAMMGAHPLYLSCAFILEEGLPFAVLEKVVESMGRAARESGVSIVTGDTKVVPRSACDKLFINTTGVGVLITNVPPSGSGAEPDDAVLVSGSMGDHGLTVMSMREQLELAPDLASDSCSLYELAEALVTKIGCVHVLRDPTRGGLATTLNEIAMQSGVACEIEESAVPIRPSVLSGCSVLGFDPLYLANEGKLICIVPQAKADEALALMRSFDYGRDAAQIGRILRPGEDGTRPGQVLLRTPLGGRRLLGMLEGEQLPRIC